MSEEKASLGIEISVFGAAEVLYRTLSTSGLSKTGQKEAISLLCVKYGLKVVPNALVSMAPERVCSMGAKSSGSLKAVKEVKVKGPKGPATKKKSAVNADPSVVAAKATLDGLMAKKKACLTAGQVVPLTLTEAIAKALSEWKAAKALASGIGSDPLPEAKVEGGH